MEKQNKIHPHTVGAAGELIVAADLLRLGFEVFRAVSSRCSCDLIAMKDGKTYRVEVKVGRMWLPLTPEKIAKYDVLAIIDKFGHPKQEIDYEGLNSPKQDRSLWLKPEDYKGETKI